MATRTHPLTSGKEAVHVPAPSDGVTVTPPDTDDDMLHSVATGDVDGLTPGSQVAMETPKLLLLAVLLACGPNET
jgi:hypothetical protein